MSDAQTIWKLSLALACSVGAYWMKVAGSGVSNVSEADRSHDAYHDGRGSNRVRSSRVGVGGTMKGKNEHRGQIIDFETARDRELMRRWAVAHGFARVR